MKKTEATSIESKPSSSKASSHAKYMGIFLIISSLTLFTLWLTYDFIPSLNSKAKVNRTLIKSKKSGLQQLWEADIKKMLKAEIFPQAIDSIRLVRVFMLDQNLHSQFKHLKAPFKQKKNGKNLLEVSFMSHYSDLEKSEKLIVQYNLTDKDSQNMFWEHSRTIDIPEEMLSD